VCIQAVGGAYGLKNSACGGITGISWTMLDCGTGCRQFINVHYNRVMQMTQQNGAVVIAAPGCQSGWYCKFQPMG
jgi:hypothetical protein